MKRLFTSLILAATCSFGASAQTTLNQTFLPKAGEAAEPEYAIPEGQKNLRQTLDGKSRANERLIYSVSLRGTTVDGNPTHFRSNINGTYDSQPEVFMDRTNETVELSAGDKVTVELRHGIEWMHSYLYIDYDHDGVFNETNELVAYSFYSESGQAEGVNSLGENVQHNINPSQIPAFTVDSKARSVKTRMRLKIDWNSKNPVGNQAPDNTIGANAGTIIDFSVNIHGEDPATGIAEAASVESVYDSGSQSLNIPAGAYAVVYNAAGQPVMHVQGGQTVSTANLAAGVYVARVIAEGGAKVIKFVQK